MYIIKRYANGRFYDTVSKNYITRERIARLMDAGEDISVVETKTGNDITELIISQIASKQGFKAKTDTRTEEELHEETENIFDLLFKKGEETFFDVKKRLESIRQDFAGMPKDEIDKLLAAVKKKKGADEEETCGFKEEFGRYGKSVREWLSGNIDKRIEETIGKMNLASRNQVKGLAENIDELKKKIEKLEKNFEGKSRPASRKSGKKNPEK